MGIAVYSAEELAVTHNWWSDLDMVQLPAGILDQRILRSDEVNEARDRGIVMQARCAFLHGSPSVVHRQGATTPMGCGSRPLHPRAGCRR